MRRVQGTRHNLDDPRPPRPRPVANIRAQRESQETRFIVFVPVEKCTRLTFLDYNPDQSQGDAANVVEDEFFNKNGDSTYRFASPQPRWNEIPPENRFRGDECQIDGVVITPSDQEVLLTEYKLCRNWKWIRDANINPRDREHRFRRCFKVHISTHQMGILMRAHTYRDMQNLHKARAFGNNPPDPLRFNAGGLAIGTWNPHPSHIDMYYISARELKYYFDDAKRRNAIYV